MHASKIGNVNSLNKFVGMDSSQEVRRNPDWVLIIVKKYDDKQKHSFKKSGNFSPTLFLAGNFYDHFMGRHWRVNCRLKNQPRIELGLVLKRYLEDRREETWIMKILF